MNLNSNQSMSDKFLRKGWYIVSSLSRIIRHLIYFIMTIDAIFSFISFHFWRILLLNLKTMFISEVCDDWLVRYLPINNQGMNWEGKSAQLIVNYSLNRLFMEWKSQLDKIFEFINRRWMGNKSDCWIEGINAESEFHLLEYGWILLYKLYEII